MKKETYVSRKVSIKVFLTDAWTKIPPTTTAFMLFIVLVFELTGCQRPMDQEGELAENGISPQVEVSVSQGDPLYSGEQLFRQHCIECHSFEGSGGNLAPDLTAYNSRSWLT